MIRVHCADCDGGIVAGQYACVRCNSGMVAADDFDDGPVVEPDAVPVSFVEAAALAAQLGGPDALLLAVGALRKRAA